MLKVSYNKNKKYKWVNFCETERVLSINGDLIELKKFIARNLDFQNKQNNKLFD